MPLWTKIIMQMEKLFERHDDYLADVPMGYVREIAGNIDWNSRLIVIKGPKGVGKSTIMLQHIKKNFAVLSVLL